VLGLEPLHMVSPPSDDPRRLTEFPDQTVDCLLAMTNRGVRPRDIVTPSSLRNALTVAIAMGGSTNVLLHSVEIARAAGIDLWAEVLSQDDFNQLARRLPVLVNMRPFGDYSMVDVDAKGGLQVIANELLEAGFLDGHAMTCTGETLAEQLRRLDPPAPDQDVIYSVEKPFKDTGGLRLLRGNLAPEGGAILKVAGVEGGVKDGVFTGRARVFNGERPLIAALDEHPDSFQDNDMVVIRYEGPRGAPGMPELLEAGFLDGDAMTCTGETLAEQLRRLAPPAPDQDVIYAVEKPFKDTGGLRLLRGNLAPEGGAILKIAGVEGGVKDGVFTGRARVFNGERSLIEALDAHPDSFGDNDMVVIRYEGPRGAPGMPELLDPTSRITALCRQRHITIALMTDARFSGGSVGLVIGHVAPEALLGGPIALVEDGDTIVVDLTTDRLDCRQLGDPAELERRAAAWRSAAQGNGGVHPDVEPVTDRVLARMRATALPALLGGGMA